MQPHRRGQHLALDVAPLADEILHFVPVRDPRDVLRDDRPLIQIRRHIVRGRPDDFDPARLRLVVRLRPYERGQEGVVDVDDPPLPFRMKSGLRICM